MNSMICFAEKNTYTTAKSANLAKRGVLPLRAPDSGEMLLAEMLYLQQRGFLRPQQQQRS